MLILGLIMLGQGRSRAPSPLSLNLSAGSQGILFGKQCREES